MTISPISPNPGVCARQRLSSESAFDINPESFSFLNPSPAVDIAKWREDISGPLLSGQDLFFMSELKELSKGSDAISEYSMDSAYQSQSGASRRGGEYQSSPIQDQTSQLPSFMTQGISPSLASDSFAPFAESHEINQGHQLTAAGNLDFGNGSQWFANNSAAQDFPTYSPSMARGMHNSSMTAGFTWSTNDVSSYNYAPSLNSYNLPNETEFFQTHTSPQRQLARPRLETSTRPVSYFANERTFSHASTHSSSGRASVTPVQPLQSQSFPEPNFESQQIAPLGFADDAAQASQVPSPLEDHLSLEDAEDLKSLEEQHHKVARSHALYSKEPDADGLYRCPQEGESGCNHKPTTLKCNYDKYVDSHLKPFRCKDARCESIPFSSTACLLRHEREAHGLHGHGARPNLCHFVECERSLPGHGFPRRYNLFDHMRRVHGWQGDKEEASATMDGHAPGSRKGRAQKRKATASATADKKIEKKLKISRAAQQQQLRERQRTRLNQEWSTKKQSIANLLTSLNDLGDLGDAENAQLHKDFTELFALREKYQGGVKEELAD
ncbi:hypothetical protein N0V90_001387 [Kalmusia sp. IMI 367209]|nr:hypothetical protein N0V90_001387 [Kalmusia sp. IMI 367209]